MNARVRGIAYTHPLDVGAFLNDYKEITGSRCGAGGEREQTRTEVVVLQADFSVARDVGVPVGHGLEPGVDAAVAADSGRERGTEGAKDGHRRRRSLWRVCCKAPARGDTQRGPARGCLALFGSGGGKPRRRGHGAIPRFGSD